MTFLSKKTAVILSAALFALASFAGEAFADGNVTVTVNNGKVTVKGQNNTSQTVIITAVDFFGAGRYRFSDPFGDTTFNGANVLTLIDAHGSFRIDLGSGSKLLVMTEGDAPGFAVEGDLRITNKGSDLATIILDNVYVFGPTQITTKNGDDAVILYESSFVGRTRINSGSGQDMILASNEVAIDVELEVKTGNGDDYAILNDTTVFGEIDIRSGNQNDTIGIFNVDTMFGKINGNGGMDILEASQPMLPYTIQSIEGESNAGYAAMLQAARNENVNFDAAINIFFILGLGG